LIPEIFVGLIIGIITAIIVGEGRFYPQEEEYSAPSVSITAGNAEKVALLYTIELEGDGGVMNIFYRPVSSVEDIAFSPDGKRLAVASFDSTVRVWDLEQGVETLVLKGHGLKGEYGSVNAVAFSPNGEILASGSNDQSTKIWDVSTGEEMHTLESKDMGRVTSLTFSPDGTQLASASHGHHVELWNTTDFTVTHTLVGHTHPVRDLIFSHDGSMLASLSEDGTIRFWDTTTGEEKNRFDFQSHFDRYSFVRGKYFIVFTPEDKILVSFSTDSTDVLEISNVAGEIQVHSFFDDSDSYHNKEIAFNTDGTLFALVNPTLEIWNADNRGLLYSTELSEELYLRQKEPVSFSPDGRFLAIIRRNTVSLFGVKYE
jgi:WD40 repeat protein